MNTHLCRCPLVRDRNNERYPQRQEIKRRKFAGNVDVCVCMYVVLARSHMNQRIHRAAPYQFDSFSVYSDEV